MIILFFRNNNFLLGILKSPPQMKHGVASYAFKVLLYGRAAVGKTTLVSMLSESPLPQIHSPTSGKLDIIGDELFD